MKKPIHSLISVGVITSICAFLLAAGWRMIGILSDHSWCSTVVNEVKNLKDQVNTVSVFNSCYSLLVLQIQALAFDSKIILSVIALCLLILVTIVLADARLALNFDKDGAKINIDDDTADSITNKVEDIKESADSIKDIVDK